MAIEKFFVPKELDSRAWEKAAKEKDNANPREAPLLDRLEAIRDTLDEIDIESLSPSEVKKARDVEPAKKKAVDDSMKEVRPAKQACQAAKDVVPKWLRWAEDSSRKKNLGEAIGAAKKMATAINDLLVDLDRLPMRVRLEFDARGFELEQEGTAARRSGSEAAKKAKEILWLQWQKARTALQSQYKTYEEAVKDRKKKFDQQEAEKKALKAAEKEVRLTPSFQANKALKELQDKVRKHEDIALQPFEPSEKFEALIHLTDKAAGVYLVRGRLPTNAKLKLQDALEGQKLQQEVRAHASFDGTGVVLIGKSLATKKSRVVKGLKLIGFKNVDKIETRNL